MIRKSLAIFFFAFALLFSGAVSAASYDRVTTVNIAPGEFEKEAAKDYSTKITFSSETKIPYGGVYVRIFDASGIALLKKLYEKPWLFLKLPVGDYHVVAVDRHQVTRMQAFHVKDGRQTLVPLTWPKSVVGY